LNSFNATKFVRFIQATAIQKSGYLNCYQVYFVYFKLQEENL